MSSFTSRSVVESLEASVSYIRSICPPTKLKPRIAIVLGSGLGSFVNQVEIEAAIPYTDIPGFIPPSVEGHKGRLILGHVKGTPVAVLQGRVHFYEGHSMVTVVHPVRTAALLGCEIVMLTNSAGGLDPSMKPGDFMVIDDHINLMGDNPLKGPNIEAFGPRFPDMTEAYDRKLSEKMSTVLTALGTEFFRGIYCGVSGPTYETPSEVRYLQLLGGKAVGMSTVPETIAANHLGLRVCALSCITNLAAGLSRNKLSHEEVTETARAVEEKFGRFLADFIGSLED
ncbi:MAG: purine-nucleoside phosphorylase [Bdellovibrionales bacterium]|jgi:purine-nucleoside phosphorylase|nr:purine-nucleoside phosphorylase [Bdellovibrionales bacterium]